MILMTRGDLGKMLHREKKLPEELTKIYAAEILLGVEDLHSRDIVFRDLKPENVVLDEEGHAMLTDFGLSKEGMNDTSTTKSFCGSVAYLAPEILNKTGHGKSLDWYLFGLMVYEMLVGIPPYYSSNKAILYENIRKGSLRIPYSLSPEAKDLITKLLIRNPVKRLGAGKEGAEEIKKHPWFKEIDWDITMKRGLEPPKPVIKAIATSHISPDIFLDSKPDFRKVENWSVVNEDGIK